MVYIKKFFKDIYNKGNFKDYFKRNKLFFIIAICLVVLSVYTGINHTQVNNGIINFISSPIQLDQNMTSNLSNSPFDLFIENMIYSLYTLLMGLSLSILSTLIVVAHGVKIGNSFSLNSLLPIVNDVFILVGSFLLTKLEIRFILELTTLDLNKVFARIKVPLKDLILTLTLILIFVLIMSIVGILL